MPVLFVIIILWGLVIRAIYKVKNWHRFRLVWILALPFVFGIYAIASAALHQPTADSRFEACAKTKLPKNRKDLGMGGYADTYYFRTTPKEIERLIKELKVVKIDYYEELGGNTMIDPLPKCPDFRKWKNGTIYKKKLRENQGTNGDRWYYEMIVNSARTEAYILVMWI